MYIENYPNQKFIEKTISKHKSIKVYLKFLKYIKLNYRGI